MVEDVFSWLQRFADVLEDLMRLSGQAPLVPVNGNNQTESGNGNQEEEEEEEEEEDDDNSLWPDFGDLFPSQNQNGTSSNSTEEDNGSTDEEEDDGILDGINIGIGGSDKFGITYSPYKRDGSCKSATQVEADWAMFARDYGTIRLYGVDCDQVATGYRAAQKYGNKLFVGIFDIGRSDIDEAVRDIAQAVDGDWDVVDTVSIGNERVNNGQATAEEAVSAVKYARSQLREAGYEGPVVTVDTFVAVMDHPELCDASDYCAVNIHPFFDGNVDASGAGPFISSMTDVVRESLADSNQRMVVTETGWPWQGQSNGKARAGMSEQEQAIKSIRSEFSDKPDDLFLFTAFNDLWKPAETKTFMAEQYWGMYGKFSPMDADYMG